MEMTIKKTVLAAMLGALSVSAVAEVPAYAAEKPKRFYVEAGLNRGSGETEFDGDGTITSKMDTSMSTLTFGYIAKTGVRFELALVSIDASFDAGDPSFDEDGDSEFSGFDLNGKLPLSKGKVRPYLGAGMGFYDWKDTGDLFVDGEDLSGVSLNLMAGVLVEPHPHVEVELGAQHKTIFWQTVQFVGSSTEIETSSSFLGLQAGVKVKF